MGEARVIDFKGKFYWKGGYFMSIDPNLEKWKSMPDLLEYLDMSREAVLEAITKHGMPAHKIGRLWKFKFSEVDEWIRSGQSAKESLSGEEVKDE